MSTKETQVKIRVQLWLIVYLSVLVKQHGPADNLISRFFISRPCENKLLLSASLW